MKGLFIGRIRKLNSALPGLLLGILLFGVICEIFGLFLVSDKINYSIGLLVGVLTAVFMAFHMAYTLNHVVEKEVKGAQAQATRHNIIRYFIVVIILGILMITKIGNPLAAFAGIMGLKVSAYLQPVFLKLSQRKNKQLNMEE